MMLPFWIWYLTTFVALGAIAVSAVTVIAMKYTELYAAERARDQRSSANVVAKRSST